MLERNLLRLYENFHSKEALKEAGAGTTAGTRVPKIAETANAIHPLGVLLGMCSS